MKEDLNKIFESKGFEKITKAVLISLFAVQIIAGTLAAIL